MTLSDYWTTLRRSWLVIVILGMCGAAAGYGYAQQSPTEYRSTTSVLVSSELGDSGTDLLQGSTYVQNLVASYAILARSEKVLQPVIDEASLSTTPSKLARRITAESPADTVLIDIAVTGSDPEGNANIANLVRESLSQAVADVSPSMQGQPAIRLTTIQVANVPEHPFSPNTPRVLVLGLLVGLVAGGVVAFLRRALGLSIKSAADIKDIVNLPVLGEIARSGHLDALPADIVADRSGAQAESVRGLTMSLKMVSVDRPRGAIVMCSASPREGATPTAIATALVLAETDARVLLVDADLRAPGVHSITGLSNANGLSSVLVGDLLLADATQRWENGVHVLTSGPTAPNSGQLITSDAMTELLQHARKDFDWVIIDSAPLSEAFDSAWLGALSNGVVVVARRGRTSTRTLTRALSRLRDADTRTMGVVINSMPRRHGR